MSGNHYFVLIGFLCFVVTGTSAIPMLEVFLQTHKAYNDRWAFNSGGAFLNDIQMSNEGSILFPANATNFQIIGVSGCLFWKCGLDSKSSYIPNRISVKVVPGSNFVNLYFSEVYSYVDNQCSSASNSVYLPMGQSIIYTTFDKSEYNITFSNSSQSSDPLSPKVTSGPSYTITSPDVQPAILVDGTLPAFRMTSNGIILPYGLAHLDLILPTDCEDTICGLNNHKTYTYSQVSLDFNNQGQSYVTMSGIIYYSPLDDQCLSQQIDPNNLVTNVPYFLKTPVSSSYDTLSVLYQYD